MPKDASTERSLRDISDVTVFVVCAHLALEKIVHYRNFTPEDVLYYGTPFATAHGKIDQ